MLPDLCGLVVSIIHAKFVPPVEIAQKCIILFYKDAECQSIMKQCFMEVVSYNILVFEVSVSMYLRFKLSHAGIKVWNLSWEGGQIYGH